MKRDINTNISKTQTGHGLTGGSQQQKTKGESKMYSVPTDEVNESCLTVEEKRQEKLRKEKREYYWELEREKEYHRLYLESIQQQRRK